MLTGEKLLWYFVTGCLRFMKSSILISMMWRLEVIPFLFVCSVVSSSKPAFTFWKQSKIGAKTSMLVKLVCTNYKKTTIILLKLQCKEWGFLLKKLFGIHLGTGDHGHLVIDHSAMLLRQFRSLCEYSGQGFEASHKLHRQLFSRAINHDSTEPGQSSELNTICEYLATKSND